MLNAPLKNGTLPNEGITVSYGGILSCVCIAFPGLNKTSSRASAVDLSNEGGFLKTDDDTSCAIVAGNGRDKFP